MNKVTIVIGTYKRSHLIHDTLESIISQSYKDFKLIIVDDNHPDDREEIIKTKLIIDSFNDKRIKYIKNSINLGVPFVFRKWISLVDTEYFMIFGDGDKLLPNTLKQFVTFLDENPRASMVHGIDIFSDKNGSCRRVDPLFQKSGPVNPKVYLESHLLGGKYGWSQASALYRTEFFRIKNIPIIHDFFWDFYFHCAYLLFSEKIGYLNEYTAIRRVDSHFKEHITIRYFTDKIERIFLALQFIDEYQLYLLSKRYPINNYRVIIVIKLLRKSLIAETIDELVLCVYAIIKNISKLFIPLTISIGLFPLRLLSKILFKLIKKR